ncbi:DUF4142 domain-containing protein [Methylorubrum populi]|jgi:predicted outer membrane protein|uniref:DUF4142 domain-containing protein n=1 Tax=Methylorubrum rhodesianum TaxID=29427 RepID=A0ABU9Z876_9HYPH|nr:DUF4142 domain-containing protein [Methylorubrum rhodesianum]MBK3402886.1 DUF4142 domain-containing protein [Methylorubrum rhodesianum]MBY0143087.1 DUF4142 domain-containing protein [Methylorubrum populi]
MAVIGRRAALVALVLLAVQPARSRADDDAGRFVEAAYASAVFQERISRVAAAKATRPGIKVLAERVRDFRSAQLPTLGRLAAAVGIEVRDTLDLELRSIVENIEPLDYLALSRRYAEVESQALEKEIAAYEEAARSSSQQVRGYAATHLETLRSFGKEARDELKAVGP